jgi:outer membrane protein, multidrug efflux system
VKNNNKNKIDMKKLLIQSVSILFILCSLGCSSYRIGALPEKNKLPEKFDAGLEATNISELPWKDFFKDSILRSLIDTALKHNYDILISMQRIEIAEANVIARKAALFPSIDIAVSGSADRYGDYTMNGVGNFDTNLSQNIDPNQRIGRNPTPDYFVGARSSWEIDLWGKLKAQKKAAKARYLASQKANQLIQTNLIAKISILYYQLAALTSELEIVNRNIKLQEKALLIVEAQKEGGQSTELAVQQFKAQALKNNALAYHIRLDMIETENTLNYLLGRFPQPITLGESIITQKFPTELSAGVPSQLLLKRPDIQQAEFELAEARFNLKSARAAAFLNITPYTGYNSFNSNLLFVPESFVWGVLGGLTTPFFRKKEIKTNFMVHTAKQKEAFYVYEQSINNGFQEVSTHLKSIDYLKTMYDLHQEEFLILSNSTAIANDLYLSGYANYLEIINAQRGALDAEIALVETKKEMFHSMINLYRSLGGGWE